jgi:MoxR-like ATPase
MLQEVLMTTTDVLARVDALRQDLNRILLERETAVEAALLALLTQEHLLLLGPPGTAKSLLVRSICERIQGATCFERLLTRFSTPEELFGPLSLAALHDRFLLRVVVPYVADDDSLRRLLVLGEEQPSATISLDESASMREDARDIWSKAAALALLSTATRQKMAWHLVGFEAAVTREVAIPVGQASLDAPVLGAISIIRTSRVMKRADVVIITVTTPWSPGPSMLLRS